MSPHRSLRAVAPLMHILIAVSTFFVLVSSWWMMALPLPSDVFTYRAFPFQLHKNIGLTVVILVGVMFYARRSFLAALRAQGVPIPPMPTATAVQNALLYGLILACCLSGYLSSVYSGWATRFWWVVDLPNWGYDSDELNLLYSDIHWWTTYGLMAVMAYHIGLSTYRGFRNDGIIRRMLHL